MEINYLFYSRISILQRQMQDLTRRTLTVELIGIAAFTFIFCVLILQHRPISGNTGV